MSLTTSCIGRKTANAPPAQVIEQFLQPGVVFGSRGSAASGRDSTLCFSVAPFQQQCLFDLTVCGDMALRQGLQCHIAAAAN